MNTTNTATGGRVPPVGSLTFKARARKGIDHITAGVVYRHHFGSGFQELVFPDDAAAQRFAESNGLTFTGQAVRVENWGGKIVHIRDEKGGAR